MLLHSLHISKGAFEAGTGWTLKPEGACKGPVCIPLSRPPSSQSPGDIIDVVQVASDMGMPLVASEEHRLWALGPAVVGTRALVSAEAPDLGLPDVDGNLFNLASLRGQKVLLYAWAPY